MANRKQTSFDKENRVGRGILKYSSCLSFPSAELPNGSIESGL